LPHAAGTGLLVLVLVALMSFQMKLALLTSSLASL